MKRTIIRLSVLSVTVALGLIAIAQARHGFDRTPGEEESARLSQEQLPAGAPREIPTTNKMTLGSKPVAATNPLRIRGESDNLIAKRPLTRLGSLPRADQTRPDDDIPAADVVLASHHDETEHTPGSSHRHTDARHEIPPADQNRYADRYAVEPEPAGPALETPDLPAGRPAADESELAPIGRRAQSRFADQEPAQEPAPLGRRPEVSINATNLEPRPIEGEPIDSGPIEPRRLSQFDDAPDDRFDATPADNQFGELAPLESEDPTAFPTPARGEIVEEPAALPQRSIARADGTGRPGDPGLEGQQSPSLTIEKTAPAEIQVGRECVFKIRVRNIGQAPARGVEVHDTVPQGTSLVDTVPRAGQGPGGSLVWKLDQIGPGESQEVEMRLMPTTEGEIGSVATVHFAAQAAARTTATRPQLQVSSTGPSRVMIGEDIQLSIRISNPGTGSATNVLLLENVPEGLVHEAGDSLEFEVGTLAPGETRDLELTLKANKPGIITNTLVAQADANLEVEDRVEIEVVAPSLAVTVDGPKRRYLEREATYTMSVENPGTAAAQEIELTTYLPKGMKFVSANNAGQYDPTSHSVSWGLEKLPAKQMGSVELVAIPVEPGEHQLRVEGKAEQGLKDTAEQLVQVEGLAAILFEVVDVDDPIEVGGQTSYEIRVLNQGSKAATNVRLAALLPPEMRPISADGPTRHVIEDGRVLFAPIEKLAPKADTTFHVRVEALRSGDQRIRVQLISDEVRTPVTKEESTRVYSDE